MLRRLLLAVLIVVAASGCASPDAETTEGEAVVSPSGLYEAQAIMLAPGKWTLDIRALDGTEQDVELEPRFPVSRRGTLAWSPTNDVLFLRGDDFPPAVIVLSDDAVWAPVEFEESCQYFTETDWPAAIGSSPYRCSSY